MGLACGTCKGLGKTSTHLYNLQQKTTPWLAIGITVASFLLIAIFGLLKSEVFTEILAFCTTLLGTVTGYYFSARNNPDAK